MQLRPGAQRTSGTFPVSLSAETLCSSPESQIPETRPRLVLEPDGVSTWPVMPFSLVLVCEPTLNQIQTLKASVIQEHVAGMPRVLCWGCLEPFAVVLCRTSRPPLGGPQAVPSLLFSHLTPAGKRWLALSICKWQPVVLSLRVPRPQAECGPGTVPGKVGKSL